MWFDDERSIKKKVALASQLGLQGVGIWNLDCLDYDDPNLLNETAAMWKALQKPLLARAPDPVQCATQQTVASSE